jgi:uncharacterized repeat protein (TIGR02543 family)
VKAKDSENKEILRNISEPIGKAFALEILNGATYTATYADNSATAIIQFEGVDIAPMEIKMKKGDVPSSDIFEEELWEKNAIVKSISPIFVPITGATTYTVVCEVQEAPVVFHYIIYNTNGGSTIEQQTYPVGSVITSPTNPEKTGYIFDVWFSDEGLTQVFIFTTMPDEDISLYARWKSSTDSMKRKITGVGNFESPYALVEGIILNSGVTGSYTFTYDGFVLDQYGYNFNKSNLEFEPKEYNAYDYFDAPTLSISTSEKAYESCVDYTINSFTLDKETLYAAMKAKGETETTFTVTLKFPERSTTADTATWTKVITVSIEE